MRINIKALSVNECWQGRRFKTDKYKSYEKELLLKLKHYKIPEDKIQINIIFGVSSKLMDIDNGLKPLLDILQKKYKFNDRDIYKLNVTKQIVKKENEFIQIKIKEYETIKEN